MFWVFVTLLIAALGSFLLALIMSRRPTKYVVRPVKEVWKWELEEENDKKESS